MIVGLDFGNVIKLSGETTPMKDAISSIRYLHMISEKIYLISKVDNQNQEAKVTKYLEDFKLADFIEKVYFCRRREEKAPIANYLRITHFIDDRTEVLSYMTSVPYRYALNPTEDQLQAFPPYGMTVAKDWLEVLDAVLRRNVHGL